MLDLAVPSPSLIESSQFIDLRNVPWVIPDELRQLREGISLSWWEETQEIETTFPYSPYEFFYRVSPEIRSSYRDLRPIVDVNYKFIDPHKPDVHNKLRIRFDTAVKSGPEIYFKEKTKRGHLKIAREMLRNQPLDSFQGLHRDLTSAGWRREIPDRAKRRISFLLETEGKHAKIALSQYDLWSTKYLTSMGWEADLEASEDDMPIFLELLGIPVEQTTNENFAQREIYHINRRLEGHVISARSLVH